MVVPIFLVMMVAANANGSYFNSDRPNKIIGVFLTEANQINEIKNFSNSFGVNPVTFSDITRYLNANNNEMLPVITINNLLFDAETGMYHHDVSLIVDAIEQSKINKGEILFLIDEPLWTIRKSCEKNIFEACQDIANRYAETLHTMRVIGQLLRKHFPGSGILHIEAWAELVIQKNEYPHDNVIMLDDAEYLGFNCYGDVNYCGSEKYGRHSQMAYGTLVWDAMQALEIVNPIGRKIFLVAGAFIADGYFSQPEEIFPQLTTYPWILDETKMIGGLGIFLWGELEDNNIKFYGARGIKSVKDYINFTIINRK